MARSVLIILVVTVFVLYSCEAQRRCKGGRYDVVTSCGSHCERTCGQPEPRFCILSCAVNVCRCKNGTVRRESDQRCVPLSQCRFHPKRPVFRS